MKLLKLHAKRYRSLLNQTIELNDFNLFIGSNAAGKSTILDALRFLSEAVQSRDFRGPVFTRGGFLHLAWKGEEAQADRIESPPRRQRQEVRMGNSISSGAISGFTPKSMSTSCTATLRQSACWRPRSVGAGGGLVSKAESS